MKYIDHGKRLANGLVGLALVAAAGCATAQSPPRTAPDAAAVEVAGRIAGNTITG
jgi:hypothetical protein